MSGLVDQHGRPLPPTTQKEQMGASIVGSRPAIADPIATLGLNPADVGALMRSAAEGNSRDWQIFCEIVEERDLHYLGVLSTRKRSVAQLPMNVEDAGPSRTQRRHGDFVRAWLDRGIAQRAAFDILDAIAKGFSVHEIFWHNEAGNYWPERLVYRPQRWFEISYQDGETIWLRDDASTARLFPAHAGMNRSTTMPSPPPGSVPRPCGDEPITEITAISGHLCSPPMRG